MIQASGGCQPTDGIDSAYGAQRPECNRRLKAGGSLAEAYLRMS